MLRQVVHTSISRLTWVMNGACAKLVLEQVSEWLLITATSSSRACEVHSAFHPFCPKSSFIRNPLMVAMLQRPPICFVSSDVCSWLCVMVMKAMNYAGRQGTRECKHSGEELRVSCTVQGRICRESRFSDWHRLNR